MAGLERFHFRDVRRADVWSNQPTKQDLVDRPVHQVRVKPIVAPVVSTTPISIRIMPLICLVDAPIFLRVSNSSNVNGTSAEYKDDQQNARPCDNEVRQHQISDT